MPAYYPGSITAHRMQRRVRALRAKWANLYVGAFPRYFNAVKEAYLHAYDKLHGGDN